MSKPCKRVGLAVACILLLTACILLLTGRAQADFAPGVRVPQGTSTLQVLLWSAGAGQWQAVATLPVAVMPSALAGTGLTSTAGVLSVTTPVPASAAINTVLAGPASGAAGAVTARALVTNDLPSQLPASVGVGTAAVGGTALKVAGAVTTTGGLYCDATSSSASSPATFGFFNTGGSAVRTRYDFDGGYSGIQTGNGQQEQVYSYYGLRLEGKRQAVGPAFAADTTGSSSPHVFVPLSLASAPGVVIQSASGQTAALLDTVNSTGGTHYFQVMPTGHLIAGGTAPTAATGAAASAVSVSGTATDAKGVLTCTTTASPTAGQTLTTVTFSAAYAATPVVVISPSSAGAVSAGAYVSAVSTTSFTITEANAGPASGTVAVSYMVIQ